MSDTEEAVAGKTEAIAAKAQWFDIRLIRFGSNEAQAGQVARQRSQYLDTVEQKAEAQLKHEAELEKGKQRLKTRAKRAKKAETDGGDGTGTPAASVQARKGPLRTMKIVLEPTAAQERKMRNLCDARRAIYNRCVPKMQEDLDRPPKERQLKSRTCLEIAARTRNMDLTNETADDERLKELRSEFRQEVVGEAYTNYLTAKKLKVKEFKLCEEKEQDSESVPILRALWAAAPAGKGSLHWLRGVKMAAGHRRQFGKNSSISILFLFIRRHPRYKLTLVTGVATLGELLGDLKHTCRLKLKNGHYSFHYVYELKAEAPPAARAVGAPTAANAAPPEAIAASIGRATIDNEPTILGTPAASNASAMDGLRTEVATLFL